MNTKLGSSDSVELFLGFGGKVMIMPPGMLGCLPEQCLIGTIQKEVEKQRIVLNSIVWRKRN